jgi:hypothetical protein
MNLHWHSYLALRPVLYDSNDILACHQKSIYPSRGLPYYIYLLHPFQIISHFLLY